VLPRVVQPLRGDLGKRAGPLESGHLEGIQWTLVALPERLRTFVAGRGLSVVVQSFIIAVPGIRLDRERVSLVRSPFVMSMNLSPTPISFWIPSK
jgi:hypothetical protein